MYDEGVSGQGGHRGSWRVLALVGTAYCHWLATRLGKCDAAGAARVTGGLVLGLVTTAMLLGHWYLNTPTMKLEPLKRLIVLLVIAVLRADGIVLCGSVAGSGGAFGNHRYVAADVVLVSDVTVAVGTDRSVGAGVADVADAEDSEYAKRDGDFVCRSDSGVHRRIDVATPVGGSGVSCLI